MKTSYLLFAATLMVAGASAQQRTQSVVFTGNMQRAAVAHDPEKIPARATSDRNVKSPGSAQRTTAGATTRWYNYGDYLADASTVNFAASYLWNDTTSVDAYASSVGTGSTYLFNDLVSIGSVCDPFFAGWNDASLYSGMMQVTPSNAYTIDSVFISGIYYRNNANTAPVDTLTVAVLYGNGSAGSDLHYKAIDTTGGRAWIYDEYSSDSLFYMNMHHDTVNNHADTFAGGFTPVITKIFLTNTDTSSNYQAVIPVSINVPAGGNMPAVSLSFKSGDASFTFGDTVFMNDGTSVKYKYGMFRPLLAYEGVSGTATFPIVDKDNLNEGQFRDEGVDRLANGLYRPMWFWYNATTGGASTYQYPYFAFHLSCPTCSTVGVTDVAKDVTVTAYPNPANNQVAVSFNLRKAADVSVTLTNMLGREVAVEKLGITANGKAVFNTSTLPTGMYIYTLNANGSRIIGRFVVSH